MTDAAAPKPESAVFAKITQRIIPILFVCYIVAFLDRVNVGFAKLQMAGDLAFSDAVYGFGAGIFFVGYFLFEVPSNIALRRVGARVWIARIMITWAVISACFMFTGAMRWGPLASGLGLSDAEFTFYVLRFLLGAAEAGFFPGVILYLTFWYPAERRTTMVALFMCAIAVSNIVGSPISGAIMQFSDGTGGLRGWQWLFLLEAVPSVIVGVLVLVLLPDGPHDARWLSADEKALVRRGLDAEEMTKQARSGRHNLLDAFKDFRVWALALVYFSHNICIYAVNFWMPTIIQEFGFASHDYLRVGGLAAIPWSLAVVAQIYWARHSDRTGERRLHAVAGLLLALVGLLMLAFFSHSTIIAMIALSLVTVGISSYVVVFWSLPTAFLSGAAAAAGIAWINSLGNLGGYFGPDLIGRVRTASGGSSEAAFLALAAFALLGALIVFTLPRAKTS
ncbi:MAG TPA: MFS transporter [Caulobacterales bacterium]|nr:MFS transporter [Caulobacterales bacterium]